MRAGLVAIDERDVSAIGLKRARKKELWCGKAEARTEEAASERIIGWEGKRE